MGCAGGKPQPSDDVVVVREETRNRGLEETSWWQRSGAARPEDIDGAVDASDIVLAEPEMEVGEVEAVTEAAPEVKADTASLAKSFEASAEEGMEEADEEAAAAAAVVAEVKAAPAAPEEDPADWIPPTPHSLVEHSEDAFRSRAKLAHSPSRHQASSQHIEHVEAPALSSHASVEAQEPLESPANPAALRQQTLQKIRELLEQTGGKFTETTIPTADVPPLASAVAELRRQFDNRRAGSLGSSGLQGKRVAIQEWYESQRA